MTAQRTILVLVLIGLAMFAGRALPSAIADEPVRVLAKTAENIFEAPIEADTFLKPKWTVEPWVSTEVVSRNTVKKIGYGRQSVVSVYTTPTGTYSSDGLRSPYVQYPGIERAERPRRSLTFIPFDGGAVVIGPNRTCIAVGSGIYC